MTPEALLTSWSNVFGVGPEMTTWTVLMTTPPGSVSIRPALPVDSTDLPGPVPVEHPTADAVASATPRIMTFPM
jgi:hypothetical protein